MATFPNSYVPIGVAVANSLSINPPRLDYIIDNLLNPRILSFRQINVYDEPLVLQADEITWHSSFGNWNPTFPFVVRKNSEKLDNSQFFNVNFALGTLEIGTVISGDNCNLNYNFDYFGIGVLYGFVLQAMETINTSSVSTSTFFDLTTAPSNWDGVLADLCYVQCLDKLILDYDIWNGRLIFALGLQQTADGSDSIISTLQDLKSSTMERVNKTLENERFKNPNAVALPTQFYYQGIRGGGIGGGAHNERFYGKSRGMRINKYL